jgi:exonuclease III
VSMIVTTFNVRGLGGRIKKNKLRDLVRHNNVDFLAVQETKLEVVTSSICHSIWGDDDCDWVFRPSEGNSGGILSIWRKSCATLIEAFQGEGYVGVCLEWGVEKIKCVLINVYSKCDLPAKKRLWENLVRERDSRGGGVWCVVGDFNVVRRRDERRGVNEEASTAQVLEMFLFNNFLGEMDLEDLNILGRRFTWYHPNGRSMSRLDRMLISEEWAQVWGENALWVLPRDVSDHCPLVLKNGGWSWGPTPFRFNNFWLNHSEFKGVVEEAWRNQSISGWMSFVLKEK